MIAVFAVHLSRLVARVAVRKDYGIFWGPRRWCRSRGTSRDRTATSAGSSAAARGRRSIGITYWEKFDYWAVFWGMAIIGGSGLMLWFPEAFARVLPGWVFNIALLVHGEEALLAVGFIFTIHFFNSHLRPDKFPMDMVIFTGRVTDRSSRPSARPNTRGSPQAGPAPDSGPPSRRVWLAGRVIGSRRWSSD